MWGVEAPDSPLEGLGNDVAPAAASTAAASGAIVAADPRRSLRRGPGGLTEQNDRCGHLS
eukprot:1402050-Alexandrium_andersonii.AAC.1